MREAQPRGGTSVGLSVSVVAFVVVLAIAGFFTLGLIAQVDAGQVGVIKQFGAIDEKSPVVYQPGFHLKLPLRDELITVSTRIQKEQVDATAASKDGINIHTTLATNFHTPSNAAPTIINRLGTGYKETIVAQQIQQVFKDVTGTYQALELIQRRQEVADKAKSLLTERLTPYGIIVDEFTIPNLEFPKAFNDAIEATQIANQGRLKAGQDQERAKIEAETARIQAEGLASAQKAQAQTITPEFLQLQAIQKWNGQLPAYLTPNTPLPFIGTAAAGVSSSTATPAPAPAPAPAAAPVPRTATPTAPAPRP